MPGKLLPALALLFFTFSPVYGDIIITRDEMTLNGKILEEDRNHVKLGNYHGIFTIERGKIKEIHRTESFEADVRLFRDMGKAIDENAVKTNYQAGVEKLEVQGRMPRYGISVSPFFNFNVGRLGGVLPYSGGFSVAGDIPVGHYAFPGKIFLSDVRVGVSYFHAEKGRRRTMGLRALAGPVLQFPVSAGNIHFKYRVTLSLGVGWHNVRGYNEETDAARWNVTLGTGPVFTVSSVELAPQVHVDIIYDRSAPLYGTGLAMGAGYRF